MRSGAIRRSGIAAGIGTGLHALAFRPVRAGASCVISPAVATPRAEQITAEPIGSGAPIATPGQMPTLFRFSILPGGVVPPLRHPGASILAIESGEQTYELLKGAATVTRRSLSPQTFSIGETTILRAGESLFYGQETSHTTSNARDEVLVVLSVTLFAFVQPGTIPSDNQGSTLARG